MAKDITDENEVNLGEGLKGKFLTTNEGKNSFRCFDLINESGEVITYAEKQIIKNGRKVNENWR